MTPPPAVDPLDGPRFALAGRVVTMDPRYTVIQRGVVYIDLGGIVDVRAAAAPPPPAFDKVKVIASGGTIYPGLIELHNHLSYNALRLWDVPKAFTNRGQWGRVPEYQTSVTGPMTVLGRSPGLLPALVRYVEAKCLVAGVTTSQGVELFSNAGARRHYRGIVRNVEQTDEAALPEAATKIADVEAADAVRFLERLKRKQCFLLHLSEGIDRSAHDHFLALKLAGGGWAIHHSLAGIHCAALKDDDFQVLGQAGGSMVWSPLSNMLLYGDTAKVRLARRRGVRIGLGSDWSITGSKNLLGELKAAHLVNEHTGGAFAEREIVAMATREAAAILKWDALLGTVEAGKRADLLVLDSDKGDPYTALLKAAETDIRLVLINGVARFGVSSLMKRLGSAGEPLKVGGRARMVYLRQRTADPAVGAITLAAATDTLTVALDQLPVLAKELERARNRPKKQSLGSEPVFWSLALDELSPTGMELRPRMPVRGRKGKTGPALAKTRTAIPLSQRVQPMTLDPLTAADDDRMAPLLKRERNLPGYLKAELPKLL